MSKRNALAAILPTLAAIALVALFTALGFWQLGRAEFKRELWHDFQRAAQAPAERVTAVSELAALGRYRRVELAGTYRGERQILLDNRVRDGVAGVFVFTPLELDDGAVLVNRGWLPMARDRRSLPEAPAPAGPVTVRGQVRRPPATGIVLGATGPPDAWPWLTPYLRLDAAGDALGMALAERVVLLDPGASGGFVRDWEPATLAPQRHTAYAVQWFALAVTVLATWSLLTWRHRRRNPARDRA